MLYLILCVCAISLSLVGHYPREEPTIITHFNSKCSSNWQVSRFHETRYSIRNYTLIHCIIILPECIKKLLPHKTGCTITIQACAWLAWSSWKDLSCSWKWQYIGYRLFFFNQFYEGYFNLSMALVFWCLSKHHPEQKTSKTIPLNYKMKNNTITLTFCSSPWILRFS